MNKPKNRRISFLRTSRKPTTKVASPLTTISQQDLAGSRSIPPPKSPATTVSMSSTQAQRGHSPPNRVPVNYAGSNYANANRVDLADNGKTLDDKKSIGFMQRLTMKRRLDQPKPTSAMYGNTPDLDRNGSVSSNTVRIVLLIYVSHTNADATSLSGSR